MRMCTRSDLARAVLTLSACSSTRFFHSVLEETAPWTKSVALMLRHRARVMARLFNIPMVQLPNTLATLKRKPL